MAKKTPSRLPSHPLGFKIGGFGSDEAEVQSVARTLQEQVTFRLEDLRDPLDRPGRPRLDPRSTLVRLYRDLALVVSEARAELEEFRQHRKWRKKAKPRYDAIVRELRQLEEVVLADLLAEAVRRRDAKYRASRRDEKEVLDNLFLQCLDTVRRYTCLRGEKALGKVGKILGCFGLSSPEIRALKRRHERLSKEMRETWRRRRSSGPTRS